MWEQERQQPWFIAAQKWAASSNALVLAIDPPNVPVEPCLPTRIKLMHGLPIWHGDNSGNSGFFYLVNLPVPKLTYAEVGITYESPFEDQSFIQLRKVS